MGALPSPRPIDHAQAMPIIRFRQILVATCALLVSACVPPAPAPQPPPPQPIPVPVVAPPPQATDWRDIPLTPGDWRYGPEVGGSAARFGRDDAPQFIARCDRAARMVSLARIGVMDTAATMAITTSAGDRALTTVALPGPPPAFAAMLPAGDGFLDRIAFSRGRFVVAVGGTARLVIPSWPEFARVIEDCRS
jgi:hypothetical protein